MLQNITAKKKSQKDHEEEHEEKVDEDYLATPSREILPPTPVPMQRSCRGSEKKTVAVAAPNGVQAAAGRGRGKRK